MASKSRSSELRLTRVYDAPLRAVWDAWTIPDQVAKWWGPRGFTITTHSKELRVGGTWRYTMHGPDGVDYPNLTTYLEVEPYRKLVYDHGASDERPPLFRVTVTFSETRGKTTMDMTFALASPEIAAEMAKFIKQAGGEATWDRLAEHLEEVENGKPTFVINRTFDAPIARVFESWTRPEHLREWLRPPGTQLRFLRSQIAPGQSTLFTLSGQQGTLHVRAEYLAIEPPHRIVYVQQFVDEREQPAVPPGFAGWPTMLRNTVLFTEEAPDRTRLTLTTEPHGPTSSQEIQTFVRERTGMTRGWTASFDALEPLLDAHSSSEQGAPNSGNARAT